MLRHHGFFTEEGWAQKTCDFGIDSDGNQPEFPSLEAHSQRKGFFAIFSDGTKVEFSSLEAISKVGKGETLTENDIISVSVPTTEENVSIRPK